MELLLAILGSEPVSAIPIAEAPGSEGYLLRGITQPNRLALVLFAANGERRLAVSHLTLPVVVEPGEAVVLGEGPSFSIPVKVQTSPTGSVITLSRKVVLPENTGLLLGFGYRRTGSGSQ
jgi:hypothetical protein